MVNLENQINRLLLLEDTLNSSRWDTFSPKIFSCTGSNNNDAICVKAPSTVAGSADEKDVSAFSPSAVRCQDVSRKIFSCTGSKDNDKNVGLRVYKTKLLATEEDATTSRRDAFSRRIFSYTGSKDDGGSRVETQSTTMLSTVVVVVVDLRDVWLCGQ